MGQIVSGSKNVTTAGTAVQLSSQSVPILLVIIQPKSSNTGAIYVGDSAISSSKGNRLPAPSSGESSITLGRGDGIDELSDVWIDAQTSGEGVIFNYTTGR